MSMPQVGQGGVAIVPTFKGFRRAVDKETDASAKESGKGFTRAFSKTGTESGKATGQGFKKAFEQQSTGFSSKATRELEANVAKTSRALSAARLKQQDLVGKVRVAEAQLAEAQQKHAAGSSQVVRATERLESSTRQLNAANETTDRSTEDLRDAQARLATAADHAGDEMAEAGRKGGTGFRTNFLGGLKGFGVALAGALAAVGIGAIVARAVGEAKDFVIGSIDIASDLNESINAVQVSYGKVADEILAMGETSAQTFGLSTRDLNSYAVQLSAFAQTIAGKGGDVAASFESILGRATDFASVMNLEVADALTLFQSGLAGETEPLRKYGIDLSAAAVETFAYANGIGTAGEKLTEAQKVQARYGSLLAQTNKVAGDFANTSDELANANRRNAAEWDNIQAKLGSAFLPIAQRVATVISEDLLPVIEELVEKHGPGLASAFEDALPSLQQLAEDVLPQIPGLLKSMAETLPGLIQSAQDLAPTVLALVQGLNGFVSSVTGLIGLLKGDTTLDEFTEQMMSLEGPLGDVYTAAGELGTQIGTALGKALRSVMLFAAGVQTEITKVIDWFKAIPERIQALFTNAGSWLYASGRKLIEGFLNGIRSMVSQAGEAVNGVLEWIQGFFPHSPALRGVYAGSGWTDVEKSGAALYQQFTGGFGGDAPGFPGFGGAGAQGGAPAAAVSSAGPRELVVVDADGNLIGRMRVEARGEISAQGRRSTVSLQAGRH